MKNKLILIISIVSGIILTILLGFVPYPTGDLIGTQKWGYPIYWLSQAIYPGAPIEISLLTLFFDCFVWILSFFFVIKLIDFLIRKKRK
ncbi:MAG: hypothetical protein ACFE8M_04335 [Candidatus Hermodarchaeota archaeon]